MPHAALLDDVMVEVDACLAGHMEDSLAVVEGGSPAEDGSEGSPVAEGGLGAAEEGGSEGSPDGLGAAEEGAQYWVVPEDEPGLDHETALTGSQHDARMEECE